jgi:uncharacterized repeat protein (TIGR01451 family)
MRLASVTGLRALTLAAVLAMLALAPLALAAKQSATSTNVIKPAGGATVVTLDPVTAATIASLGVTVTPTGAASVTPSGAIAFPITGGKLDAKNLEGQVRHAGGLAFSNLAGTTTLTLDRYYINITANPVLTARVNGGPDRIDLFNVDLSGSSITTTGGATVVAGAKLTLTPAAAAALNATFGVGAFGGGLATGTAVVTTAPQARVTVSKAGAKRVRAGKKTVLVVRVRNTGAAAAKNVVISSRLPRGIVLARRPAAATIRGRTIQWRVANLAAGRTITRRLVVRVLNTTKGRRCTRTTVVGQNLVLRRAQRCTTVRALRTVVLPAVTG